MVPVIPIIPVIPVSRNGEFRLCSNFPFAIPVIPVIPYISCKQNHMRLSHPDYIKLLVEAYNKKRANNDLSLLLAQSTPAKIRQACLHVYKEQYDRKQIPKKDERVLTDFFGPAEHGKKFMELIEDFETDKFRPLDNYLKRPTEKKTDERNLELLAWLIDFKHRSYSYDKEFQLSEAEVAFINNGTESVPGEKDLPVKEAPPAILSTKETPEVAGEHKEEFPDALDPVPKNNTNKKFKRALIILMLIICTGGIYAVWQQTQGGQIMGSANMACMYWAYDHYEQVPCNMVKKGRIILPLNEEKRKNFRRILRQDTITELSVGKVYYIKDSNIIKYYTEGGSYPEDLTRNLRVLSDHIFDKYLRKKETQSKNSLGE